MSEATLISTASEQRCDAETQGTRAADQIRIIHKNVLGLISDDRFDEFKAGVFVRGHLRNYANELRLDPERLVIRYERLIGHAPSESTEIRRTSQG